MAGQSKKMAAEQLFEQRKINLKWYWKFENVCEVQGQWRHELAMVPPTRLIVACICDRFEASCTVRYVGKQRYERPCTAVSPASSAMVLEQFT
jgi:hypothetical protein